MNQKWNNDKCWCESKSPKEDNACAKDYIQNSTTFSFGNVECLASTIDDSVITCDEIVNAADSVSTNVPTDVTSTLSINFHNKNVRYKLDCAPGFAMGHIVIYNRFYLLSLYKT